MSQTIYRRKAILTRIHKALDAFYLLQRIDWEYDIRATLEKILGLALQEIELDGGKQIESGLIIIQGRETGSLEVQAGWKADDPDLTFSRTVVHQTMETGQSLLCENAKEDPRFMAAESLKHLETLSLICVPLEVEGLRIGALYIESKSPRHMFNESDLDFLRELTDTISPYLKAGLTHQGHLKELRRLHEEVKEHYSFANIIGRSTSIRNVFDLVKIATEVDRTVLITGESGCGKELIAHAIHYNGPRRARTFVVVDCSSLAEHLLESELFGHRKGAFTGAASDKIGAFEEADGGTIFLDEISDASRPLQQKLRRVLQEGEIRRVGENVQRKVNVRVICATNKNLPQLVEQGAFIRDLFFRINRFPIQVPPLRERREDIPLLVEHFLKQPSSSPGGMEKRILPEALELLVRRDWAENNVRELRNTVELASDFAPDGNITAAVLQRVFRVQRGDLASPEPPAPAGELPLPPPPEAAGGSLVQLGRPAFREMLAQAQLEETEPPKERTPFYRLQLELSAQAIIEGLRACQWKVRPAARLLGISPTKLRYDLKERMEQELARSAGRAADVARALDIPLDVLERKAEDLGLEEIIRANQP